MSMKFWIESIRKLELEILEEKKKVIEMEKKVLREKEERLKEKKIWNEEKRILNMKLKLMESELRSVKEERKSEKERKLKSVIVRVDKMEEEKKRKRKEQDEIVRDLIDLGLSDKEEKMEQEEEFKVVVKKERWAGKISLEKWMDIHFGEVVWTSETTFNSVEIVYVKRKEDKEKLIEKGKILNKNQEYFIEEYKEKEKRKEMRRKLGERRRKRLQ